MYGILMSQVPRERVELSRLAAQGFEACASTNFAISAGAGTVIAGRVLTVSTSPASHVTTRAASSGRQLMARDGHGGSEGIRTLSLLLDRQLLYPIELRNQVGFFVRKSPKPLPLFQIFADTLSRIVEEPGWLATNLYGYDPLVWLHPIWRIRTSCGKVEGIGVEPTQLKAGGLQPLGLAIAQPIHMGF